MTFQDILKDLKAQKYFPVYLLSGEEAYYIDKISAYMEKNILDEGQKAFNQIVVYGKDADEKSIIDECRQYPMMSPYRLVIVKEAQDLKISEILESYLENPVPSSILVLNFKHKKPDKRKKFVKNIQKHGVFFETPKMYDNQLPAWISQAMKEMGLKPENGVTQLLADYLGTNLTNIILELEKIKINAPSSHIVTLDDVRNQIGISKEYDVFELTNTLAEQNFVKALRIIQFMAANKNQSIHAALPNVFNFFYRTLIIRQNPKLSDSELVKLTGISPTFLKTYKAAAHHYNTRKLYHIFKTLKKCDKASKGVDSRHNDELEIFKDLLIACMPD
jgi:DNA polymerase-3 subunit delta